jgi:hypothetical protein
VLRYIFVVIVLLISSCGSNVEKQNMRSKKEQPRDPLENIKKQLLELQSQLESIVQSDWADCNGGSLSDVAKSMCKIAQAATEETRVEMRGAIQDLASQLESQIDDMQTDFATMSSVWKKLYGVDFPLTTGAAVPTLADCTAFSSTASTFECVKVQGAAITALQATVAVLNGVVGGAMTPVRIGSENLAAGPLYEEVVRLGDLSRINAYTDGLSSSIIVGTNPINATNGSSTVTITTSSAHGLLTDNFIRLTQCSSGRGFTAGDLNGTFTVLTTPTATTFTTSFSSTVATSSGSLGNNTCSLKKFSGAGFSTIWQDTNSSDTAVRRTTGGSKGYNFAICKTSSNDGKLCYSINNNNATFATISAIPGWSTTCESSGFIVCK